MRWLDCGSAAVTERLSARPRAITGSAAANAVSSSTKRSTDVLNRTQYRSDVVASVVLWPLRYRLTLRDLAEMFLIRGIVFSYEAVREWEAKLTAILSDELRQRRGTASWRRVGTSTRLTSKSAAAGVISTGLSIETAVAGSYLEVVNCP
jgi:hypothetical protein